MILRIEFSPVDAGIFKTALLFTLFTLSFSTPVVLAATVVMTRRPLAISLAVVLLVIAIWTVDQLIGTDGVGTWTLIAGVPTAAVLLLNTQRLRIVGPILYAAYFIALFGAIAGLFYGTFLMWDAIGPVRFVREDLAKLPLLEAFERYYTWLLDQPVDQFWSNLSLFLSDPTSVLEPANPDGLSAEARLQFFGILIASAITGTMMAWLFMRWLGRSYRRRHASDQMLTIDVLMVIFTPLVLLPHMDSPYILASSALGILACYRALARWGYRWRQRTAVTLAPKTLLLLRVFGFDRRTRGLLEDLGQRWRYLGPIRLIAGPDAAYTTIEPHDFYEFLAGRLSREFITGPEDLETRLAENTAAPDPDGLFRIQDFFCHEDTWRMTVARLVCNADAILMDLRGFGPTNRGCIYEIEQLIGTVDLDRVTLLTDPSTSRSFLKSTLTEAWRALPADSPNARKGSHQLTVLQVPFGGRHIEDTVLGFLCESLGKHGLEEA
jgi:hypothetical protein